MRSKIISKAIKVQLYKTLILPILLYGSEAWTLSGSDETALGCFERKILRKIYGPICQDGEWRVRYNDELYHLYDDTDVIKNIKLRRLRWAGHVSRMSDVVSTKRVSLGPPPDGRRRQGRPNLRWLDGVEKDLSKLHVRNWKERASNRRDWRIFLNAAQTRKGL